MRAVAWPFVKERAEHYSPWGFKSVSANEAHRWLAEGRPIVVADAETTGLASDDRIIELAAVRGERAWVSKFNPQRSVSLRSMAVHGITEQMLHNKPLFGEKAEDLLSFMEGAMLVGHGMAFDMRMLAMEFGRVCAWNEDSDVKGMFRRFVAIPWFCTKRLGPLVGLKATCNLEALAKAAGVKFDRTSHSALRDAVVLRDILFAATGVDNPYKGG